MMAHLKYGIYFKEIKKYLTAHVRRLKRPRIPTISQPGLHLLTTLTTDKKITKWFSVQDGITHARGMLRYSRLTLTQVHG